MRTTKKQAYALVKRLLDIVLASVLLFLLALPMATVGLLIRLTSAGGAIFRQKRIGRGGRTFVCYKFRTMYIDAPKNRPTSDFADAERYITPIGKILRRTSLDELPQLFNVIIGDMSLVGPRPLIADECEMHDMRRRCGVYSVRPGITGLAQVRGRDMLADTDKARYDARYVRRMGVIEDARIIFATLTRAVSGNGILR